ncbi:sensor histidine kinase [Rheinheimera sp. D18]|uniref:sensor histidine kinase n=1 Tax=Rheinheimera sp. D18 TaxID=2545632 RepID=UPI001051CF9B|nr:histidine kinase [Rheinheimera sp. D18]QBL08883.1 sensor histidine kinase [Rheinheimera sp. D18]
MKIKYSLAAVAGLATWALVFAITLFVLSRYSAAYQVNSHIMVAASALFLLYGAIFALLTVEHCSIPLASNKHKLLLLVQLLCAFGLMLLLHRYQLDYLAILSIIWVASLPNLMSTPRALLLTFVIVLLWFSLASVLEQRALWITGLLYGSFHIFAVLMQHATYSAQQARDALESKHRQLQATQQLLQAVSRQSERTRIARDLHDVVGHHLTALTIQLQVAGHITDGEVKTQIDKCHQLAKLLLSDVREAVSTLRQYRDMALKDAVQQLTSLIPTQLNVILDIEPAIVLQDLAQTQHLFCIIQEAISNSLKHSGASEFVIKAAVQDNILQLDLYDNGKVHSNWQAGSGITGMFERAAECAANLTVTSIKGALHLRLQLAYLGLKNV